MEELSNCPICSSYSIVSYNHIYDLKNCINQFHVVKCLNCNFLFTNPRPSYLEISSYYGSNYYSYKPKRITYVKTSFKNGKKLLDVGCGAGDFLIKMKNRGYDVYGIEINPDVVKRGQKIGLKVKLSNLNKIEYPDNYFDEIYLTHVLEHIHSINEILSDLYRCLKPNGILKIEVPNIESFDAKNFGEFWRHLDIPRHLYHFSPNTLKELLKKHGFIIKELNTFNNKSISYFKGSARSILAIFKCKEIVGFYPKLSRILKAILSIIKYILHTPNEDGLFIKVTAIK